MTTTQHLTPAELVARGWGRQLRTRRTEQGYSQVTFAEKVHKDQTTISRYERGEAPWTPEVLLCFAVALDTSVNRLFPWPEGIESMETYRLKFAVA